MNGAAVCRKLVQREGECRGALHDRQQGVVYQPEDCDRRGSRGSFSARIFWASGGPRKAHGLFVLLLKGLYQPVPHGPNLGLSSVDLKDGSYPKTSIYPVEENRNSR